MMARGALSRALFIAAKAGMTRRNFQGRARPGRQRFGAAPLAAVVMGGLTLAGCSRPAGDAEPTTPASVDWIMSPMVQSIERTPSALIVRGLAVPQGRVVLSGDGAAVYATGADPEGRFELRILPPAADMVFVVETRNGQNASPAPYRLLVSHDADGPLALLGAGSPTIRLDAGGALDVIDSDGGAALASGRARPGGLVAVATNGGPPVQARVGRDGRWRTSLDISGSAPATVTVAGRAYDYPGSGQMDAAGLTSTADASGWRMVWTTRQGVGQSSWFPRP